MHLRYDHRAGGRTVSVTLNADLCAKAEAAGLDLSRVTEAAVALELERRLAERVRDDVRRDLVALDAYMAEHGSFAQSVHAYFDTAPDRDAV